MEFVLLTEKVNESLLWLYYANSLSLIFSLILIVAGLIGNSIIIFVFSQKRFRKNSSSIYLLCLAVNDSFYLLTYFSQNTLKTYREIHSIKPSNLIGEYDTSCRLLHYFQFILRSTSSYCVMAFTIERLLVVYSPFYQKLKSTESAWMTFACIACVSVLVNIWVPFAFELNYDQEMRKTCRLNYDWIREHVKLAFSYVFLIIFLPILVTFVANLFLVANILKRKSQMSFVHSLFNNQRNKTNQKTNYITQRLPLRRKNIQRLEESETKKFLTLKPFFLNINHIISQVTTKANSSQRITRLITVISVINVLLNLPYMISWLRLYYFSNKAAAIGESVQELIWLKIFEIFNLANYSINFYIYCGSGRLFRKQLKYSSNVISTL